MTVASPRVRVADVGVDAALRFADDGAAELILSPKQTFESACRAVSGAMPNMHPDEVRRLVRRNLPDAMELADLIPATPRARAAGGGALRRHASAHRIVRCAVASVGGMTVAGAFLIGYAVHEPDTTSVASAPVISTDDLFTGGLFDSFADVGGKCEPMGKMHARCVDSDGMVMLTEASLGSDAVTYSFTYGGDRIVLKAFQDEDTSLAWARQRPTAILNGNKHLRRVGRYVLYGTDSKRIEQYVALLKQGRQDEPAMARRGAAKTLHLAPVAWVNPIDPLPQRLSALALGSLGLDDPTDVQRIAQGLRSVPVSQRSHPSNADAVVLNHALMLTLGVTAQGSRAAVDTTTQQMVEVKDDASTAAASLLPLAVPTIPVIPDPVDDTLALLTRPARPEGDNRSATPTPPPSTSKRPATPGPAPAPVKVEVEVPTPKSTPTPPPAPEETTPAPATTTSAPKVTEQAPSPAPSAGTKATAPVTTSEPSTAPPEDSGAQVKAQPTASASATPIHDALTAELGINV